MTESTALAETMPFNHKPCTVLGYEDCWVKFKTSGYPRKLRREWDKAPDIDACLKIILSYIEAAQLRDIEGAAIVLGSDVSALDNAEDAMVLWLIETFKQFWLFELPYPRKNS